MELKSYYAQDLDGTVIPGAYVYLYFKGTTTLAEGIKDATGNPLSNPFQADESGLFQVAAPDGNYDLRVTSAGKDNRLSVQFLDTSNALELIELSTNEAEQSASKSQSALENILSTAGLAPYDTWAHISEIMPVFAFDVSSGKDIGYSLNSSGEVSAVIDRSSNNSNLDSGAIPATVGQVGGRDALDFLGGSADSYIANVPALSGFIDGSPEFKPFSIHVAHAPNQNDVRQCAIEIFSNSDGNVIRMESSNNGLSQQINGNVVSNIGSVEYGNGKVIVSSFFNDGEKSYAWTNGSLAKFEELEAGFSGLGAANFDSFYVGKTSGGVLDHTGAVASGACFADLNHNLKDAVNIHRSMLKRWAPQNIKRVRPIIAYGQSNAVSSLTNPNLVVISDGYEYYLGQPLFGLGAGHNGNTGTSSLFVWFAEEWQKLTGEVVVLFQISAGGTALCPEATGDNDLYLSPTAPGAGVGTLSWYSDVRRQYFEAFYNRLAAVPGWEVQTPIVSFTQGEADRDQGIDTATYKLHLNRLFDAWNADFGQHIFAVNIVGRDGPTLTEVQNNEPNAIAIRTAQRDTCEERRDSYNVFDDAGYFDPENFQMDDLVVDAEGAYISGAGYRDAVHYTLGMYEAMGRTGARNLHARMGLNGKTL